MSSPETPPETIIAYTDGAAKGNPGPAGWAWWISATEWASGGWPRNTNNVGEFTAVLKLLEALAHRPDINLTVITDSKLVIDSLTRWVHGWKRNGWKTSSKTPVKNAKLIKAVDALIRERRNVTFQWQRGHVGAHGNTQVDELASNAALAYQQHRPCPTGPGIAR